MISVAFFNNKGGVGKTSLVYHLAWTYTDLGFRVLMADLDPQSNLTALCVDEERLEELWDSPDDARSTVAGAINPVKEELGDIKPIGGEEISDRLGLLVGDIRLARFEAKLSEAWPKCLDQHGPSYRATTALHRVVQQCGERWNADLILIDVGPNLGAINRSALMAAEWVVTPLGADLFSSKGLRNLGPALAEWRSQWQERSAKNPLGALNLPPGKMEPAGYMVAQPSLYKAVRPKQSRATWITTRIAWGSSSTTEA